MSGVLIHGAGGHGKVVADIMRCQGTPVQGFLHDNSLKWGITLCGLPVFGSIDSYAGYAATGLIIGAGTLSIPAFVHYTLSGHAAERAVLRSGNIQCSIRRSHTSDIR